MYLYNTPNEIACLNHYELLLIQLAKCFQTIIQLKPLTNSRNFRNVLGFKGNAIHLPMSPSETTAYVQKTLPSSQSMEILVYMMPKMKESTVWRQLVNMDKVENALRFLKHNNGLYKNINIVNTLDIPLTCSNNV